MDPSHEDLLLAREELISGVRDWKGLNPTRFGHLGAYGTFAIQKSSSKMQRRHYKVYLFSQIILVVKESSQTQIKPGIRKVFADYRLQRSLVLKGRIFLSAIARLELQGDAKLKIYWMTALPPAGGDWRSRIPDPAWEAFTILFGQLVECRRWIDMLAKYRMDVAGLTMAEALPMKTEDVEEEPEEQNEEPPRKESIEKELSGAVKPRKSLLVIRPPSLRFGTMSP